MGAVPLGLIGVILALVATGTTINIQSLMGAIMMVGIVSSFSIVLIDFASRLRREDEPPGPPSGGPQPAEPAAAREGARGGEKPVDEALVEAGRARLRPILMTSNPHAATIWFEEVVSRP